MVKSPVTYIQSSAHDEQSKTFQGRRKVIDTMETILSPSQTHLSSLPRTCVLHGPRGIGKSQTALRYFHERNREYDVALWLRANNAESLLAGYHETAVKLGLLDPIHNTSHEGEYNPKQVLDWLRKPLKEPSNPRSQPLSWLIVFDNVNDESVLTEKFWPAGAIGSVIITTCNPMISEIKASPGGDLLLDCLSRDEAVSLLRAKLPSMLTANESKENMQQAVELLACWPLFVVQIAGIMQRLKITPSKFIIKYKSQDARHLLYDKTERSEDGYTTPLLNLWSLEDFDRPTARLMSVLSLLLPNNIPEFVLKDTQDASGLDGYPSVSEYDFSLSQLEQHSIITRMPSSNGWGQEVSIHSVIQKVVRAQLLIDVQNFSDVFRSTVRMLMAFWDFQSIPTTEYKEPAVAEKGRWERCKMLLPHMGQMRMMFDSLHNDTKQACATEKFFYMMNEAGWHHFLLRNLDEATDWADRTLRYFELCGIDEYPMLRACQYATLSAVARTRNQPGLAYENYDKCFSINLEVYRKTNVVTSQLVAAYTELARVLIQKGDLEAAEIKIEESIRLRKQMPNFKRVQLYSPIIFGSYIHMIKGNFKIAEKQLLQALNDRKEEYKIEDDVKSKRSGHILYCLGNVVSKDRPFEGSEYFHRSLKVFQQTGSDFDLDLAQCCYKLAQYYLQEESSDTATQMIDKAIEIFSHYKYFEPHHARALWVKSQIMSQTGDCKGAHAMEIEALEILRGHVSGDREWSTALSLEDLDQLVPVWDR